MMAEQGWQAETDKKELDFCMNVWRDDPDFVDDCRLRYLSGLVDKAWPGIVKGFLRALKEVKPKAYFDYLCQQVEYVKKDIAKDYKAYERYTEQDVDYVTKQVCLLIAGTEEKIKNVKRLEIEKTCMFLPKRKDGITQDDIQKALQFPIGDIVGPARNNMVKCINHQPDNHPSMSIKNNFCYCFTCGYSGSVIDVAMRVWGLRFVDAVRRLKT